MGLPAPLANGTNRIAIFAQNIFAVSGFKSKGVSEFPFAIWVSISALIGAIIGASLAVDVDGRLFNRILAVIMVVVIGITIFNPLKNRNLKKETNSPKKTALSIFLFFFIGIYGGFIQAGVGFLIISILTMVNGYSLVRTNSIKVFVALVYTFFAIIVFIIENKIDWTLGLTLACGNSLGAWFASRWSVEKGDKWIRIFLIIAVAGLAIKLWFFNS